jgi:hypothetical protein
MPLLTSLTFTPSLRIDGVDQPITNLDEYLNLILSRLNIIDIGLINKIKEPFTKDSVDTLRLLSDVNIHIKIKALLDADAGLNTLVSPGGALNPYYNDHDPSIKSEWDDTMNTLAKLQSLIIIRKSAKGCRPTIDALVKALADKIDASNNLLELELELK